MFRGVYAGVPAKRIEEFSNIVNKRKTMGIDVRPKIERFDEIWNLFNIKYKDNKGVKK